MITTKMSLASPKMNKLVRFSLNKHQGIISTKNKMVGKEFGAYFLFLFRARL